MLENCYSNQAHKVTEFVLKEQDVLYYTHYFSLASLADVIWPVKLRIYNQNALLVQILVGRE